MFHVPRNIWELYTEDMAQKYKMRTDSQKRAEKDYHKQGEETDREESMPGSPNGYIHNFNGSGKALNSSRGNRMEMSLQ
jgi:hypothetical protein